MNIHKYTSQETDNAALGQAGSVFCDTTGTDLEPTKGVFVAIQILDDVTFTTLEPEEGAGRGFISTGTASNAGQSSASNNLIDTSNTFPAGTTLFGRWSKINIATGGSFIAYIG